MLNESTQNTMSIIHSYHAIPQKKHSFLQDLLSLWSTVACPISRSGGVSCWSHFPLRLLHLRLRWLRAARDQQTGCESGLGAWLESTTCVEQGSTISAVLRKRSGSKTSTRLRPTTSTSVKLNARVGAANEQEASERRTKYWQKYIRLRHAVP